VSERKPEAEEADEKGELDAKELGEEELDEVSGGDPGYFHPNPPTYGPGGH
jgi:hypothetical protein